MGHGPFRYVALVFLVGGCLDQEGAFVVPREGLTLDQETRTPFGGVVPIGLFPDDPGQDPHCYCMDSDFDAFGNDIVPGQDLTDTWSPRGVEIGPSRATALDSNDPTGGDTDLASPTVNAPGLYLDNLMILAENTVDLNGDGLIDDPDDDADGGLFEIWFSSVTCIVSADFVDVGDAEAAAEMRFYNSTDANPVHTITTDALPDNYWQRIQVEDSVYDGCEVRKLEIELFGSGAVDNLSFCIGGLDVDEEYDERCL